MTQELLSDQAALVVVDVQKGFNDEDFWGRRNNPECESNIAALLTRWRETRRPVVFVRHDSENPDSPLFPASPGHAFQEVVTGEPDLQVVKSVNSSFHGDPDLHEWLQKKGISELVICGITTNHCCETTARVGGNLGYNVFFALDATYTFDRTGLDGENMPAELLAQVTAANLHGEFATVCTAREIIALS